jgi:hypothetical protein
MFTFIEAEPVKRSGPGRNAEPNPFEAIIGEIALKTDDDNGLPIARAFEIPYGEWTEDNGKIRPADDTARAYGKALRQLSEAGLLCNPQVTVNKDVTDAKYKNGNVKEGVKKVTFWTVAKIRKNRKADTTADATTDENADENAE